MTPFRVGDMIAGMNSFAHRMTRRPLPFDVAGGQDVAAAFADLGPDMARFLALVAGGSPYLRSLLQREGAFLRAALAVPVEDVVAAEVAAVVALPLDALAAGLRRAKRRVALWTALCDLGGVWELDAVTGALTALADAAVAVCVQRLVAEEVRLMPACGAALVPMRTFTPGARPAWLR